MLQTFVSKLKSWLSYQEGTPEFYEAAFDQMSFDPGYEKTIDNSAQRVLAGRDRYQKVALSFPGMPWYFIGALHNMEASCSFAGVLHNGEKILGTGRKTTLVPKGRGPFETWEQAAVDALRYDGFAGVSDWSLGQLLKRAERFNGTGYITGAGKAQFSPYIWSQTSIAFDVGKYVADGRWNPSAPANAQTGVAAVLKRLEQGGHISIPRAFSSQDPAPGPISGLTGRQASFLRRAEGLGYSTQAQRLLDFWRDKRPGSNPRYYALVDFSLHESKDRLFVIDAEQGSSKSYRVAHGSGSDKNKDGRAETFSNSDGSHASSLGIFRCAETYQSSKFGYACRVDGLEPSNSAARARAVVIHKAWYVAIGGDTWGCFGLRPEDHREVIDRLKDGSPLISFA